ncbi:hypothetical protein [Poseidonibacter lekithochrous]|uniref:hypothetical protein n=1 Tax=Poseidonibacter lekithochrous TaxID=1904463 RepID=UPI000D3C5E22|nr:hypothetical protein [Poseidonibacter lekithochrous]
MKEYLKKIVMLDKNNKECSLDTSMLKICLNLHSEIESNSEIIYRAVKEKDIVKRFIISEASGTSFLDSLRKIFYFGDKAKYCLEEKAKFISEIQIISDKTLKDLILLTNNILKEPRKIDKGFISNNREFFEFYSEFKKENLEDLSKMDYDVRVKLRNLLIMFLHTQEDNPYKDESLLVSTTTSLKFAKSFLKIKNPYIIISWIPYPEQNYVVRSNLSCNNYEELKDYGFPILNKAIYEIEKEVSVIGALFPHFIFGIYDVLNKKTILNPAIFDSFNKNYDVIKYGLLIDQTNFEELLNELTVYERNVKKVESGVEVDSF